MLNKIQSKIKLLEDKLKLIPCGCEKCKVGKISGVFNLFGTTIDIPYVCECQQIEIELNKKLYRDEIEQAKQSLENKIFRIKKDVHQDYWHNVFWSNQPKQLIEFYNDEKTFCWIWSNINGNGKTSAANSFIIKQIMDGVIYNNKIIKEINLRYDTDTRDIFIDDVMKRMDSQRWRELVPLYYSIIDQRKEDRKKIIFTSNFSLEKFFEEIANVSMQNAMAIRERMNNRTVIIELTGESFNKC